VLISIDTRKVLHGYCVCRSSTSAELWENASSAM
jgi:hypothetical protein